MSLVSNYIGGISPEQFGEKVLNSNKGFNTDDTTFSDLLEKQMNVEKPDENNWLNLMGYDSASQISSMNIEDLVSAVNSVRETSYNNINNEDVTTSEMLTFLTSPIDLKNYMNHANHDFMNFARKHASNVYNKCASNVVTNLTEFVEDTMKLS